MRFVHPTDEQVDAVAHWLRPADRLEAKASDGIGASEAVWRSWNASAVRHGIESDDGEVIGLCGVCPDSGAGQIWMLGTEGLTANRSHRLQLARHGREWVDGLLEDWKVLHNWVFAANHASIEWLEFMGFTVWPAQPHGPYSQLFRYFFREAG